MGISYLPDVASDLVLHAVAELLCLPDPLEELAEGLLVSSGIELLHLAEHALHLLSEHNYLLLRLQHGDFRGLHETAADELQAEFLFFLSLLGLDDGAHKPLYLGDKPDEDSGVHHVEGRVEGRQGERKLHRTLAFGGRIHPHDATDHAHEGEEQGEHPQYAEHIEEQVRHCRPAGLGIGGHGREVGGHRGADVLSHNEGYALKDGNGAGRTEYHRDGHQRSGRLHEGGQYGTDEEEQQDGAVVGLEAGEEVYDGRLAGEIHLHTRGLQHTQGEEQETQSEQEIAHIAVFAGLYEDDGHQEYRPDHVGYVEGETGRHDPGAHGGADIGAHDYGDGLGEGEEGRIHEGYRHDGGCGGRLDGDRHQGAGGHAGEAVGGHCAKEVTQLRAGHFLEGLTHHLHSIYQEGYRAQKFQDNQHRFSFLQI